MGLNPPCCWYTLAICGSMAAPVNRLGLYPPAIGNMPPPWAPAIAPSVLLDRPETERAAASAADWIWSMALWTRLVSTSTL